MKHFYEDFKQARARFQARIQGIDSEPDLRTYTTILLNRLLFIYFLQCKGLMGGDDDNYLQNNLSRTSLSAGPDTYYRSFLLPLFFEGFARPACERTPALRQKLGRVVYLNNGLFSPHRVEKQYPAISISDAAFANLFRFCGRYTWNLDETPPASSASSYELRPHILSTIFERALNQKPFGAYYTPPEIAAYLCERTIHGLLLERINLAGARNFASLDELFANLDADLCRQLLEILSTLSILDPACGSGVFLISALHTLLNIYQQVIEHIDSLSTVDTINATGPKFTQWLHTARTSPLGLNFYLKATIITDNLFGVDIMEEATEMTKLSLLISLLASVPSHTPPDRLDSLAYITFNVLPGNALIGLLHSGGNHIGQSGADRAHDHRSRDACHRSPTARTTVPQSDGKHRGYGVEGTLSSYEATIKALDVQLLAEFNNLGIQCEQAAWDPANHTTCSPARRPLTLQDIADLHPFHWSYEFERVMTRGGFDIVVTNPPWEALKPQDKEFFAAYSDLVTKKKMRIEDFEKQKATLLQDTEIRQAYADYLSRFPHQSAYFRTSPHYANQISTIDGKKQGTDLNYYKLFTERCYNLLHAGGHCGLVVPSGIYTDLGSKQLRALLFAQTRVTGLFCFENNKAIFENVHRSFKFAALTFEKGRCTHTFPAAFMRHRIEDLYAFPEAGAVEIPVVLIRQLSPTSLSIMEFQHELDLRIAQKMLAFPLLGESLPTAWNLLLTTEFHMTNNHMLFQTAPAPGLLPLYEGKMIHQFAHSLRPPRYWLAESQARQSLLGRRSDSGQELDYQYARLAYRSVGRTTDRRTLIATILPPHALAGNSLIVSRRLHPSTGTLLLSDPELLFLAALLNSFLADYFMRQKISANLNMFYLYQLPIPRLSAADPAFQLIVEWAARLVCTTPEYEALWHSVLPASPWSPASAASDPHTRATLRAELDALVAHLYGLTGEEFSHVLSAFPLVEKEIKEAARAAFHHLSGSRPGR